MRARPLRYVLISILVVAVPSACGPGGQPDAKAPSARSVAAARLCNAIEVPLEYMEPGETFAQLVVMEPSDDKAAVGSMIAFLYPAKAKYAGRFRPTLRLIARRADTAINEPRSVLPVASDAVIRNAKALDAFIAGGGCKP